MRNIGAAYDRSKECFRQLLIAVIFCASARKLCLKLPRVAVDEAVMKVEERQVESADMDAFDELFGINRYVDGAYRD